MEIYIAWLAPGTSIVRLFARLAYHRSSSELMVRSEPAINIQLGLVLHAAAVMTALKFSAKFGTCERAMNAAFARIRHVSGYIHQADNRWIISCFGCDSASIAMSDKNAFGHPAER